MKKLQQEKEASKKYSIELTEEQIAIIKAGLRYHSNAESYGHALWTTCPGACFGSSDSYYLFRTDEIYEKLNEKTKIKPDYGWWGNINQIIKLCKADYEIAKKEGEKAEIRLYEDAVLRNSIQKEIDKCGLNGEEIIKKASKVCREELEAYRNSIQVSKKTKK